MTASTETERAEFLQMHADFEREFGPMPQDCKWSGREFYQTSHHAWQAQEYANKFDGFKAAWQAARRAPAVTDTRARYSGSIQELKQYASEDVDAMVHICNKHIGNVPKGFFLAMQECAALVGRAPAVPVPLRKPTIDQVADAVGYHDSAWDCVDPSELIDAILMLAAAPQPSEAAPVQLLEPVAKIEGGSLKWHIPDAGYSLPVRYLQGTQMLYTEHQVLAILAQHGIKTK